MRRGEVWWVNFEPFVGSEPAKVRPAVLVSNDGANSAAQHLGRGVLTVVPLTSSTAHVRPYQSLVSATHSGLSRASKAQAELVRTVDASRFLERIGAVTHTEQADIDRALRLHLNL